MTQNSRKCYTHHYSFTIKNINQSSKWRDAEGEVWEVPKCKASRSSGCVTIPVSTYNRSSLDLWYLEFLFGFHYIDMIDWITGHMMELVPSLPPTPGGQADAWLKAWPLKSRSCSFWCDRPLITQTLGHLVSKNSGVVLPQITKTFLLFWNCKDLEVTSSPILYYITDPITHSKEPWFLCVYIRELLQWAKSREGTYWLPDGC